MSLLQPILAGSRPTAGRNQDRRSSDHVQASATGDATATICTNDLPCCASWYRENLAQCSEAMLQYEWAWLHGRIHAIEQFLATPPHSLARDEGDACRGEQMLRESHVFRALLQEEFAARDLQPSPPKAAVVPSEEAWEITSQKVREDWGIA